MVANAIVAAPKVSQALVLRQANELFHLKRSMKFGIHYGPPYPGSKKETLLKPGAEMVARRFGVRPAYHALEARSEPDFDRPERSFVMYRYQCDIVDIETGTIVGSAIGSCNSMEDKYRLRTANLKCPDCGAETLIMTRRSQDEYWCAPNKGGCGHNIPKTDPRVTSQEVGKVVNPNPMDLANTIDKMAQKRSFVSGVILATGASQYFAPGDEAVHDLYIDLDDENVIDGEYTVEDADPQPRPGPTIVEPPTNGNGHPQQPPPTGTGQGDGSPWDRPDALGMLRQFVHAKTGDSAITDKEMAKLAGVVSFKAEALKAKYPDKTVNDVLQIMVAAYEQFKGTGSKSKAGSTRPATKASETNATGMSWAEYCQRNYHLTEKAALLLLGIDSWKQFEGMTEQAIQKTLFDKVIDAPNAVNILSWKLYAPTNKDGKATGASMLIVTNTPVEVRIIGDESSSTGREMVRNLEQPKLTAIVENMKHGDEVNLREQGFDLNLTMFVTRKTLLDDGSVVYIAEALDALPDFS